MTTVSLSGYLLDEALSQVESLAADIESARISASNAVPSQLVVSALSTSGTLGQVPDWLRQQKLEPLTVMRDLAYLLDDTGSTTEFTSTGVDMIRDAKEQIGLIYADRFENIGDIDSPEDREAMLEAFESFERYADDGVVSGAMLTELGAEGLNDALYQLQGLVASQFNEPNYYASDKHGELQKILELQDIGAEMLARATASASSAYQLPADFGREFVEADARGFGVATLFQYADKSGVALGTSFLVDAGEAILQREAEYGGPGTWYESLAGTMPPLPFGTDSGDDEAMNDPGLQWLQALDANPVAAQKILLNEAHADYLLGERQSIYEDPQGAAAGEVLRAATVDLAFDRFYSADAAAIATPVGERFGSGNDLLDGADEEVAAMLSTYIADVDRVGSRADGSAGETYRTGEGPDLPPWLRAGDLPPYGITMEQEDLRNLLEQIGDNHSAVTVIGETTARYNQVRLDHGSTIALGGGEGWAAQGDGDPFMKAVYESSQLQGFLVDAMVNGDIDNQEEIKAAREELASLFSLPGDYVKHVPGVGSTIDSVLSSPVGGFIFDNIKESATDAYVGDGVSEATARGNGAWNTSRYSLRLQALHALLGTDLDVPSTNPHTERADGSTRFIVDEDLREAWPTVGGRPVPPATWRTRRSSASSTCPTSVTGTPRPWARRWTMRLPATPSRGAGIETTCDPPRPRRSDHGRLRRGRPAF